MAFFGRRRRQVMASEGHDGIELENSTSRSGSPTLSPMGSPRAGSPRLDSPRGGGKPRGGMRFVLRVAATHEDYPHEEISVGNRMTSHDYWYLVMHKVLPIAIALASMALLLLFFNFTGLKPTCEASPKRYVEHQDGEYRDLYNSVKKDLDHETTYEGIGARECPLFVDWLGDVFFLVVYYYPAWIYFLTTPFEDIRAATTYLCCALMVTVGWFMFSVAIYEARRIRHHSAIDPIVSFVLAFFALYMMKRDEFNGRAKYLLTILMPVGTIVLYFLNLLILSILVNNLAMDTIKEIVMFYPLTLALTEHAILAVSGLVEGVQNLTEEELHPAVTSCILFFESMKYAIAVYTFDEDEPERLLYYILVASTCELIRRSRLLKRLFLAVASKIEGRTLIIRARSKLDLGFYATKYELQYLPLIFLLFVRGTGWMVIPQPGNHLNREGDVDQDFELPYWFYLFFLGAGLLVDAFSILAERFWHWFDYQQFEVRSWKASFYAFWYGMCVITITISATSSAFYEYRFR